MSSEKRRLKEQMLINSAIASIKKQLNDLENSRKIYIDAAITARNEGIASQYRLAKNAIRIVTAQKTVVEQMLLNLQLSSQIKDVSEMTKSFADGMKLLSGSLTNTAGALGFDKVKNQMDKAVRSTNLKTEEADAFLRVSSEGFENFADSFGASDDDIEKMIEGTAGGGANGIESNVDDEIAALERKLKGGA